MRVPKATFKKSGIVALVSVLGLLMTSVGPASAVTAGEGGGTGWEYPPEPPLECPFTPFPVPEGFPSAYLTNDRFELSHYGTYVTTGPPEAAYLGGTDVTITVGPHYISPVGTHPDPILTNSVLADCPTTANPPSVLPLPVPITDVYITGDDVIGEIECFLNDEGPNEYIRVTSVVLFTFSVDCTITGNVPPATGTTTVQDIRHVIEGTMNPCALFPPIVVANNPECQVFEDPEGPQPRPETAGSHLVTTYQAVEPDPLG